MPGKPKGLPKTGGRSKGAKNKRTVEAVQRVEWVLSLIEQHIERDVKVIEPNERMRLWNDLQEYVRPKLARTDIDLKSDGKPIRQNVIKLSDGTEIII